MWGRDGRRRLRVAQPGQALVETALVLPLLLLLAFGIIGAGRVARAKLGVSAVAREAARAAAQASDAAAASRDGYGRAAAVAGGYGLGNGSLAVVIDTGGLAPGDMVRTAASYEVRFGDLPLLGWARVRVASRSLERVDLYRSRWDDRGVP